MRAQSKTKRRTRVSGALLFGLVLASASLGSNVQPPDQRLVEYRYDALDRLTGVTYDGALAVTYAYDAAGNLLQVEVSERPFSGVRPGVRPDDGRGDGGRGAAVDPGVVFLPAVPAPPSAPRSADGR